MHELEKYLNYQTQQNLYFSKKKYQFLFVNFKIIQKKKVGLIYGLKLTNKVTNSIKI